MTFKRILAKRRNEISSCVEKKKIPYNQISNVALACRPQGKWSGSFTLSQFTVRTVSLGVALGAVLTIIYLCQGQIQITTFVTTTPFPSLSLLPLSNCLSVLIVTLL